MGTGNDKNANKDTRAVNVADLLLEVERLRARNWELESALVRVREYNRQLGASIDGVLRTLDLRVPPSGVWAAGGATGSTGIGRKP